MSIKKISILLLLTSTINASATWCISTHLVFNTENVKAEINDKPFRIGTLDEKGYSLAVVKGGGKTTYRYLRNISIDEMEFREFRYDNFIFQLALPDKDKKMIFREVLVDKNGIERGFAGYCS